MAAPAIFQLEHKFVPTCDNLGKGVNLTPQACRSREPEIRLAMLHTHLFYYVVYSQGVIKYFDTGALVEGPF